MKQDKWERYPSTTPFFYMILIHRSLLMSRNSAVECLTVNQDVAGSSPAETVYLCNYSQMVKVIGMYTSLIIGSSPINYAIYAINLIP